MTTIYDILVSDGVVALHLLLTMIVIIVVMLRAMKVDSMLKRVSNENADLKRQISDLSDIAHGEFNDMRGRIDAHQHAIHHAGDYLSGMSDLDLRYFERLEGAMRGDLPILGEPLINVDFHYDDGTEPDFSQAESAFVTPDSEHLEPDVSMPLRASMITMPDRADVMTDTADEAQQAQTDMMTRVLHRSRGQ